MHQLDMKSTFLNGPLEEVYGFVVKGEENKVYKLKKILCGLKQVPRAWNKRIDSFLSQNMEFMLKAGKTILKLEKLVVCLYVDDLLVTSSSKEAIIDFKG
ncbi:hypothetical protein CR513_11211, partial [Mucuna pruriens]